MMNHNFTHLLLFHNDNKYIMIINKPVECGLFLLSMIWPLFQFVLSGQTEAMNKM